MKKRYDYLIVGAGLYGAMMAWRLNDKGKKCLVIDRRSHTGGNIYCENTEGINVHKYGAHIFHTSNKKVWDFVNSIVPFNRYTNSPLAKYHGRLYNLPFNMNTFARMWNITTPDEARRIIEEQKQEVRERLNGRQPQNLEEQALMLVGKDIYEVLIKEYTEKQWGRPCTELPAFIIKRLPVRFVYDNNYFNDTYQGIPIGGYNKLIDGLLNGSDIITGIDFFKPNDLLPEANIHRWREIADKLVFTAKIDQFYDYCYGRLDYRSLRFEHETLDCPNYQGNAVVNYTDKEVAYTRTIEHKHFEMFGDKVYDIPKTVVTREYPQEWHDGLEPYYPVNDDKNSTLYARYKALADQEPDVIFGGRLAEYKYYDMAPIVEKIL
ncbi:MAG: UDP-galactopyranose mutase [Prevotella sp.]|nr:UDP-galactopyranose mutase [Prevotella sp.]